MSEIATEDQPTTSGEEGAYEYGGITHEEYEGIVNFKLTTELPPGIKGLRRPTQNFKSKCENYYVKNGLLYERDRIVLKKGEVKDIMQEIHEKTAHSCKRTGVPMFKTKFSYGGIANGRIDFDYSEVRNHCPVCKKLSQPGMIPHTSLEWKDVKMEVDCDVGSRTFTLNFRGLDSERVKEHNEKVTAKAERDTTEGTARSGQGVPAEEYDLLFNYLRCGVAPKYTRSSSEYGNRNYAFMKRVSKFMLRDNEVDIRFKDRPGNPILVKMEEVRELTDSIHRMMAHIKQAKVIEVISGQVFWTGIKDSLREASYRCSICRRRKGTWLIAPPNFEVGDLRFDVVHDQWGGRVIFVEWGMGNREDEIAAYEKKLVNWLESEKDSPASIRSMESNTVNRVKLKTRAKPSTEEKSPPQVSIRVLAQCFEEEPPLKVAKLETETEEVKVKVEIEDGHNTSGGSDVFVAGKGLFVKEEVEEADEYPREFRYHF